MAKSNGRNTVVQLGSGSGGETAETPAATRLFSPARSKELLQQTLITPVPVKIAIEKLRGFVADHQAKIVSIDGSQVRLEIEDRSASRLRRLTDRGTAFLVDLSFEEERLQNNRWGDTSPTDGGTTRTKIKITLSTAKRPRPAPRRGVGPRPRGLGQFPLLPDGRRRRVGFPGRRADAGQAGVGPVVGEIGRNAVGWVERQRSPAKIIPSNCIPCRTRFGWELALARPTYHLPRLATRPTAVCPLPGRSPALQ